MTRHWATMLRGGFVATAIAICAAAPDARSEEIVVSNYGVSANGMPYAVALEKGFFKAEGANVTGIITSAGGGTTLRNMLAGNAPTARSIRTRSSVAIQQGADLKIVSDNVLTVAEFVWVVKPDSPIKTVADLKGKKIGYTNPRSTSQALAIALLQSGGLKTEDAELVKTGGFGEGIAALDTRSRRRRADARAAAGRSSRTSIASSPSASELLPPHRRTWSASSTAKRRRTQAAISSAP